jgi:predicted dehydrogenase
LFRIGILGLTHDHVWNHVVDLERSENAVLTAAADPNRPLLDRISDRSGCRTYTSYLEMLDGEALDAVYVFSDNATSVTLTEMATGRGLHVMVEKPMAATLTQAERMLRVAKAAGVMLMVNWPFAWWRTLQCAMRLARRGDIGELFQVRYRAAHAGPKVVGCSAYFCDWLYDPRKNGAGALMDYCCYGAVLSRYLLGQPSHVLGVALRLGGQEIAVDDNAMLLLTYDRALGVAEASWTQIDTLTSYTTILYGSKGTVVAQKDSVWVATSDQPSGQQVDVSQEAGEAASATDLFLSHIASGQPLSGLCSAEVSRDAQEILEAGLISAQTGAQVSLPL